SFEHAFAQVNRLRGMAFVPFAVLAHIEQDGLGIFGQASPSLRDGDLGDFRADFVDDFEESRRMFHGVSLGDDRAWSTPMLKRVKRSTCNVQRSTFKSTGAPQLPRVKLPI